MYGTLGPASLRELLTAVRRIFASSAARNSSSTEVRALDISGFIEARVRYRSSVPYLCFFVLFLSGQIKVDPPEPSEDYEILVFSSDFTMVGQSISAE